MGIADKRFHTMSQVGFVVRDLDKTVAVMREKLGVEPTYGTTPEVGREYRGEPGDFVCRMAFFRFSNIELEFIQPIAGTRSIWQDFLDSGREGLHHIRFSIDSQQGVEEDMASIGIPVYQKGMAVSKPGHQWAYFDSEPVLGFIIETFNELEKLPGEEAAPKD